MKEFVYTAIDRDGRIIKSTVEAQDEDSLLNLLSSSGLYPIRISKRIALRRFWRRLNIQRLKRRDLIEFSNNMSIIYRAGIPIVDGLRELAETEQNPFFREILGGILRQVELGSGISDAIALYRNYFPTVFTNLVKVGEETGRLDESFKEIAEHLKRMDDLYTAMKRAMLYPVFAIIATLGALLFWLVYVLPKIMGIFKDIKIELPFTTRVLLALSDYTKSFWFVIPVGLLLVFIIFRFMRLNESMAYYLDRLILRLPVIKLIVYNKILAILSEQMRILIISGITFDRIFDMVADVVDNLVFKMAILKIKEGVLSGSTISDEMVKEKIFPQIMTRMIRVGESSGNLDEQLKFLSDFYIARLDDISQRLQRLIEPVVIVIIGAMFAFIIIGLIGPVYEIISGLGKM